MLDTSSVNYDVIFRRYDIETETKEKPEAIAEKMLGSVSDARLKKVAEDVVFMNYKGVEADVKAALEKTKPEDVIEKGLVKGMDVVGELYGRGIYYLPHVMVAAQAMDKGIKTAEAKMKGEREARGTVVMHVAEGDPHDIGKNIAAVLLRSNGYAVFDLGRDVNVDDVVKVVEEKKPDMLTGTALMTTTMSAFPKIADRLIEKGIEVPFVCAGGAVNRSYVESYPLGVYADKANQGPVLAAKAVEGWDYKKIRTKWDDLVGAHGAK
ncbi:MAG TPA: B12-binding domain-containing protein, partial [Methanomassiliicoccales archaeon]|nr:B12-binding domain-containing protein [Methanomassiliicoccales archaeon]